VTSASGGSTLAQAHLAHTVEAVVFLAVGLGVAAVADMRQRSGRIARPPRPTGGLVARLAALPISVGTLALASAVAGVGAAAVHFAVMPEHFHESWLYGTFFLGTATAQVAWSVVAVTRPGRPVFVMGALANGLVVALWLVTRLVGIPIGPAAGTTEDFGALDLLASAFEVFVSLTAALVLIRGTTPAPRSLTALLRRRSVLTTLAGLAAVVTVTACAAPPS
jgi:hypothetical protein